MKSFTLRSQFYIPNHSNLITKNPSQLTKTHPRFKLSNKPIQFDLQKVKTVPNCNKFSSIEIQFDLQKVKTVPKCNKFSSLEKLSEHEEPYPNGSLQKVDNSRYVIVGAVSVGLMMLLMSFDDNQKALAFGPEGPLMEDFWDNMRRYGLYALTVSSGVLYAVFQPLYELLKNPISAILVLTILGGGFYIVSQVVSAMVGITEFSYEYTY